MKYCPEDTIMFLAAALLFLCLSVSFLTCYHSEAFLTAESINQYSGKRNMNTILVVLAYQDVNTQTTVPFQLLPSNSFPSGLGGHIGPGGPVFASLFMLGYLTGML